LQPGDQFAQVAPEAAERPLLLGQAAVVQFDQHGEDQEHAMHVQSGDTMI